MTPAGHAEQRARDYVRDRGWRHEPLTWEEIAELLDWIDDRAAETCTCGCIGMCAT